MKIIWFRLGAGLAALAGAALPLAAQPSDPAMPAGSAAPADDRVVLPMLRGLVFVTDRSAFHREGVTAEGVKAGGNPILDSPAFHALAEGYVGRPLTRRSLNDLTREVVLFFRQHGRPVVDVLVPEQNITTGTVQVMVVEGRVGTLRTEGNRWFTAARLESYVRARPGDVIEGGPLLADMAWINQNPFRQVDLVYSRGDAQGLTDIVLRTRDRLPLRVYTGYEDSGNALTGFDRILAGFNWGDVFGTDEQFNYQLTASPDFEKMVAHSGSYIIPIPGWRDTLTVLGSYAESHPDLGDSPFGLRGRSWQVSARYRIPLPVSGTGTREFTAGVDFKRSNNNLSFGGSQVFAQDNDVVQALAAVSQSLPDRYGQTSAEFTVVLSPGGLTRFNHTSDYLAARAYAASDYVYARLDCERRTKLPADFSWVTRLSAQWSNANLLASEQLGLGGASNLRGYEEREANGDNGFSLVDELHGPPQHLARLVGGARQDEVLDPLVFFDWGVVGDHQLLPGEPAHLTLASAGPGLRYNFSGNLTVRADYGWQLKESGVSDHRRTSRGHLSVILAY